MKKVLAVALSVTALTGCAKHTNEIPTQYVSTLQYSNSSCSQIESEMGIVSRRASEIGGQVDKTASDDSAQMGIGLVLFWPALFFLDGNTPQAAEYGRLKGEFEALENVAVQKDCGLKVEPIKPKPLEPADPNNPAPAYPTKR